MVLFLLKLRLDFPSLLLLLFALLFYYLTNIPESIWLILSVVWWIAIAYLESPNASLKIKLYMVFISTAVFYLSMKISSESLMLSLFVIFSMLCFYAGQHFKKYYPSILLINLIPLFLLLKFTNTTLQMDTTLSTLFFIQGGLLCTLTTIGLISSKLRFWITVLETCEVLAVINQYILHTLHTAYNKAAFNKKIHSLRRRYFYKLNLINTINPELGSSFATVYDSLMAIYEFRSSVENDASLKIANKEYNALEKDITYLFKTVIITEAHTQILKNTLAEIEDIFWHAGVALMPDPYRFALFVNHLENLVMNVEALTKAKVALLQAEL